MKFKAYEIIVNGTVERVNMTAKKAKKRMLEIMKEHKSSGKLLAIYTVKNIERKYFHVAFAAPRL